MMPNVTLYAVAALVFLACIAGAGYKGYSLGEDHQKTADQKEFDAINQNLGEQKTQAAAILEKVNAENMNLVVARDALKTSLEKKYAAAQASTAALRTQLSTVKLQFRVPEAAGCGNGGSSPPGSETNPAAIAGTALIQLPDEITRNLLDLAESADQLADAYRLCYGWAQQAR